MAGQHSLKNIENTQNVKFIQHNCAKSTNAMISCLEYALLNQIDIVLFQEPWSRDQKTISHPSFTCIMPKIATYRSRDAIFVTNGNSKLQCTPRTDLIDDSDMQIIEITIDEVRKVQIFNFYFFYLFIKCIQPKVMTLNYFRICFYITNKSTLYNPSMYCQFFSIFTPC